MCKAEWRCLCIYTYLHDIFIYLFSCLLITPSPGEDFHLITALIIITHTIEKETATPSSLLAWEIPWTEEPGGPQSMGSQESDTTHHKITTTTRAIVRQTQYVCNRDTQAVVTILVVPTARKPNCWGVPWPLLNDWSQLTDAIRTSQMLNSYSWDHLLFLSFPFYQKLTLQLFISCFFF